MDFDDILYLICLLSSVAFGKFYRNFTKDENQRKLVGTALGLLIAVVVCRIHVLHALFSFAVCALIITYVSKSICHLVSFGFVFTYLFFFRMSGYCGFPDPTGPANMVQMMFTLKIVGLAFEANTAYNKIKESKKSDKDKADLYEVTELDREMQHLSILEMFHYCFSYIGFLTGPYYRYRTFRDYFDTPFKNHVDCWSPTMYKLGCCAIYAALHLGTNYFFPASYATDPEFYEERTFIYRLCYIWPMFIIFRMRIYIGLVLSECICTNAGFGAYPEDCDIASGEGPKKQYLHYKNTPDKCKYSFQAIKNMDVYETETCWTFREAMKTWNICVQYWLAMNVYKRFPSKKYRNVVTLLVSAFWHGIYVGYYFCIMGAPFYVPLEAMYNDLFRKDATGLKLKFLDVIFCFAKFCTLGYLGMAFCLLTFDKIMHYYSSVYFFGYVMWAIFLAVGLFLKKQRKATERRARKEEGAATVNPKGSKKEQ